MSTSVIGLPLAGHVGMLSTSTLPVRTSGKSLPSLPSCVSVLLIAMGCVEPDRGCSCLIGVPLRAVLTSMDAAWSLESTFCFFDGALLRVRRLKGKKRC